MYKTGNIQCSRNSHCPSIMKLFMWGAVSVAQLSRCPLFSGLAYFVTNSNIISASLRATCEPLTDMLAWSSIHCTVNNTAYSTSGNKVVTGL